MPLYRHWDCTGRMVHRGSRGIALLFLDHGTRRGWGSVCRPERKKKQGNRCTNFMRRNSALSYYSLSRHTKIDWNRTKIQDTEYLQFCVYLSLIYIGAKNASNGIWNTETPFESECYMLMTTEEEMIACACFLACKMRNTDYTHDYRQINLVSEQTRSLTTTA